MRHWTRRFTLQHSKVGQALNASSAEISKEFLHDNIRGILLAETSGLTSSWFASVLATSGTTSAEGGKHWQQLEIFTSCRKPSVHSGVMLRWQREMPRPGNLKQL